MNMRQTTPSIANFVAAFEWDKSFAVAFTAICWKTFYARRNQRFIKRIAANTAA
jgi:hypothetical protein